MGEPNTKIDGVETVPGDAFVLAFDGSEEGFLLVPPAPPDRSAELYGWDRCDHSKGIGKIGCVTCDPIDKHVRNRLRWLEDHGRVAPAAVGPMLADAIKSGLAERLVEASEAERATDLEIEMRAAYNNLGAVQERCTQLLIEKRSGPGAIRVKRLTETAILPKRAHDADSGLDLHADLAAPLTIPAGARAFISTGIAVSIPRGFEAQVRPRSGLARKHGIATFFGTVDAGYVGDVGVTLLNTGREAFTVHPGDRIAQLVFAPVVLADLVEVEALDETERGTAGFGSSGR